MPFSEAENFDYDTALLIEDERKDYGEKRIIAYGYIGKRLHVLCFKPMSQTRTRIISLRKGNKREEKFYEENI